jgi:hypothetical protein
MRWRSARWYLLALFILLMVSILPLASCITSKSSSSSSEFYDAGAADLSVTGAQFDQYLLFRFDTTASGHILALPSAADIITNLSSPYAGEVFFFAVTADGSYPVTLVGGTNVTIKPSVSTVAANTTVTMYCEFDSITSGSEAVTIY